MIDIVFNYQTDLKSRKFIEKSSFERLLRKTALHILKDKGVKGELSIVICDNEYIKKLNCDYRSKNDYTDVITFPLNDEDVLGEIYISQDFVLQNEKMRGLTFFHEIAFLLIHGCLHILGYTHKESEQRAVMNQKEEEYFKFFKSLYQRISYRLPVQRDKRFLKTFSYAFRGMIYALRTQRNMRIHVSMAIFILLLGLYYKIEKLEWLSIVLTIFLVIVAEAINTAIEVNVDLVTRKNRARAMVAKDVAAGAVLMSSIGALVIGVIVFGDRILASIFI